MTETTALSITELQQQAQEGDAQAQLDLAYRLEKGEGIEKNIEVAFHWLKQAAEAGNAEAQYELATSEPFSTMQLLIWNSIDHFRWINSNVNSDEAFSWILKSAEKNYAKAQYVAALCYFRGVDTQRTTELGVNWLLKAEENGLPEAQHYLAGLYDTGSYLELNKSLGFEWLEKSAISGLAEAQYKLANCYRNGNGVEQNYEQAYEWLTKYIGQEEGENYDNACMLLGDLCAEGKGVQKNDELAITWYERYAQKLQNSLTDLREQKRWNSNYPSSLESISNEESDCLRRQVEVKTRIGICCHKQATRSGLTSKQAYEWHKKAADNYCGESQYWLSRYYLSGDIYEQTEERISPRDRYYEACDWADQAIANGCKEAYLIMGFICLFNLDEGTYSNSVLGATRKDSIKDFENAVDYSPQGIAEYFLADEYQHSDDEKKRELAGKYYDPKNLEKVWNYYDIDRLLKNDNSLREKIYVLIKDYALIEANKRLEESNQELQKAKKELEEMLSMFAHKFRSPLDTIIYNTTHENQAKLYTEAAQTMRGLLDVFIAISTDSERLKERIKQDNQGQGRLLTLFLKTLDMLMLHLLSPTGAKKIRQHYLAHAKAQGQCAPDLSYKAWREGFYELEQQMQAEWEQSYAQLLNQSESLEPRLAWVEQHFFKLELPGFDNEEIQFEPNEFKESFLMILLNEILVNVFKYYSSEIKQPVVLEWHECDGYQVLSCHNPSVRSERSIIKGSGKGHVFLSTLARKTGSQFVKPKLQDDFVLEFGIPNELLLAR